MSPFDGHGGSAGADVCMVLEGTYPYVKGGVSTWVHDLIGNLPEVRFALAHVAPERGTYARKLYSPPANVVALSDLYCREPLARGLHAAALHVPAIRAPEVRGDLVPADVNAAVMGELARRLALGIQSAIGQ